MKLSIWIVLLLSALLGTTLPAQAAPATVPASTPTVTLSLLKVVTSAAASSGEQFVAATSIAPGDTVEYRAVYANGTADTVKGVYVTLPVPAGGLEVLPIKADAKAPMASLDGKHFEAMPLMRTVMLADGTRVQRPVPLNEIRFLRWSLGDMPAAATRTVSARMQLPAISPVAVAAAR